MLSDSTKEMLILKLLGMGHEKQPDYKSGLLEKYLGRPVLIETCTKYYSGRIDAIKDGFIELGEAQWVASTGRLSKYIEDPGGDNNAEFEPVVTPLISIGAIVAILPLPKLVRELK